MKDVEYLTVVKLESITTTRSGTKPCQTNVRTSVDESIHWAELDELFSHSTALQNIYTFIPLPSISALNTLKVVREEESSCSVCAQDCLTEWNTLFSQYNISCKYIGARHKNFT